MWPRSLPATNICLNSDTLARDRTDETRRRSNCLSLVPILSQAIGDALNRVAVLQEPADEDANVVEEWRLWVGAGVDEEFLEDPLSVEAERYLDLHRAAGSEDVEVLDVGGYLQTAAW